MGGKGRYGFGFRGGRWFTLRKIQKQQQKLLNPKTPSRLSQVLRRQNAVVDFNKTPNSTSSSSSSSSSKAETVSKVLGGTQSA
jgi:hypothetical protein